ncbi:MAG: hypothetical protein ABEK10_03535 [Candidatus Nanosalina sp.]
MPGDGLTVPAGDTHSCPQGGEIFTISGSPSEESPDIHPVPHGEG